MTIIQIQTEMNRPARIPLVTPGMPWISVTLLATKYLSQVALRRGESQNMRHSWVVTVPLAVSMVLAHTSNAFHTKVRLPKMHALDKKKKKKILKSDRIPFSNTTALQIQTVKRYSTNSVNRK